MNTHAKEGLNSAQAKIVLHIAKCWSMTSHQKSVLWNSSNNITMQGSVYHPCTDNQWWDVNTLLVLCVLTIITPRFLLVTDSFWPVNYSRPSSAQLFILKTVMPCIEKRSGHAVKTTYVTYLLGKQMDSFTCFFETFTQQICASSKRMLLPSCRQKIW